jgi:hypothetical protein
MDAIEQVLVDASPKEREHVIAMLETHGADYFDSLSQSLPWAPASGTQRALIDTQADQTLFGGSAGGGKSEAIIGYSMLRAKNALLLRRQFPQLQALQTRLREIWGGTDYYKATESTWFYPDGRTLELGSCPHESDVEKFQGRPHDALLLDEAAHFSEQQINFLTGWLRSADGRPCRLILASNPPMSGEGAWLIDWFRPWIDPSHPNPAQPGELRWFKRLDGRMQEVGEGTEQSISRTYIPSRLADNPYLGADYERSLANLPVELRQALLDGDFFAGAQDRPLQVLPNSWIRTAQQRWTEGTDLPLTHVGVDCSRGGRDRTVIVCRHRNYVAEPIVLSREQSATGGAVTARILEIIGDENPRIRVDGIGVGSSVVDHLQAYVGHLVEPVINSQSAPGRKGEYINRRAYDYWNLRQRLDPATSTLELPPSTALYSELSAPEYTLSARGIQVQSKEDLIRKLGRSPDIADAVVLACSTG